MNNDSINRVEPKDVTPEIAGSVIDKDSVNPVDGSGSYSVHVELRESTGKCRISGSNSGSIGRYDFVAIYKGAVPSNPNTKYEDYFYMDGSSSKTTSLTWGTGYSAAYASYDYRLGKYVVLAKTIITG